METERVVFRLLGAGFRTLGKIERGKLRKNWLMVKYRVLCPAGNKPNPMDLWFHMVMGAHPGVGGGEIDL